MGVDAAGLVVAMCTAVASLVGFFINRHLAVTASEVAAKAQEDAQRAREETSRGVHRIADVLEQQNASDGSLVPDLVAVFETALGVFDLAAETGDSYRLRNRTTRVTATNLRINVSPAVELIDAPEGVSLRPGEVTSPFTALTPIRPAELWISCDEAPDPQQLILRA